MKPAPLKLPCSICGREIKRLRRPPRPPKCFRCWAAANGFELTLHEEGGVLVVGMRDLNRGDPGEVKS